MVHEIVESPPSVPPPVPLLGGGRGGSGLGGGFLNNYAVEPQPYYAEYPAPFQQRRYLIQGAIAALFVTSLVIVSAVIS